MQSKSRLKRWLRGYAMSETIPELAFYYPGSRCSTSWVKNLLLFFDGVAVLAHRDFAPTPGRVFKQDSLIDRTERSVLLEQGLVRVVPAGALGDRKLFEDLLSVVVDILATGAIDDLASRMPLGFRRLNLEKMGYDYDGDLVMMIVSELRHRGLAYREKGSTFVDLHPVVHSLVLVLLAQLMQPFGRSLGVELHPATDRTEVQLGLTEFLSRPSAPFTPSVVTLDLQAVGLDLSTVPLPEILEYRRQHRRRYRNNLRSFVTELSLQPQDIRDALLEDRELELSELAASLRREARSAWRRSATVVPFLLGISGAALDLATGNTLGGLLQLGSAATIVMAGGRPVNSTVPSAYSFLFNGTMLTGAPSARS